MLRQFPKLDFQPISWTITILQICLAVWLFGTILVQAQGPPPKYAAQTNGFCGGGPCNSPATWMTGSNANWSFSAEFPPATYSWSQQICCDCDGGSYWTYAYVYGNPGGTFTLSGPDDQIFTGYFQHPGTFAVGEGIGLAGYGTCHGILYTLSLGINFTGEWSNGTRDVGTLSFNGSLLLSPVDESRTGAVGSGTATIAFSHR